MRFQSSTRLTGFATEARATIAVLEDVSILYEANRLCDASSVDSDLLYDDVSILYEANRLCDPR